MQDRQFGHIYPGNGINIFVKPWAMLLNDANWRYEFFRSKLEFQATTEDTVGYIRQKHAQYFPNAPVATNGDAASAPNGAAAVVPTSKRKAKSRRQTK
jgi:hypothetical protein